MSGDIHSFTITYEETVIKTAFVEAADEDDARNAFYSGDFEHGQEFKSLSNGGPVIRKVRDDGPVKSLPKGKT